MVAFVKAKTICKHYNLIFVMTKITDDYWISLYIKYNNPFMYFFNVNKEGMIKQVMKAQHLNSFYSLLKIPIQYLFSLFCELKQHICSR